MVTSLVGGWAGMVIELLLILMGERVRRKSGLIVVDFG
jgi:hypothetical protein